MLNWAFEKCLQEASVWGVCIVAYGSVQNQIQLFLKLKCIGGLGGMLQLPYFKEKNK